MKKLLNLIIFMSVSLLLFGCAKKENINPNNDASKNSSNTQTSTDVEKKSYRISLFFPTEEYIVNGNEDLKFESILENFEDLKEAMYSINNLKFIPENAIYSNGEKIKIEASINESIKINSIKLEGKTFFVDLGKNGLDGGSLDEDLLISSIVKSLLSIESSENGDFTKVGENVKFTVDGENVNTLMGHFDTSKPIDESLLK